MKKLTIIVLVYLAASIVLVGCYYDKELDQDAGGLPTNVSLSGDVQPIFTKSCATSGCHDAGPAIKPSLVSGVSYNALSSGGYLNTVVPSSGKVYQQISEGNMPPGTPLTSRESGLIIAWLNEGAKNN